MIPRFKVGDLASYYPVDVVYNEAIVSEERTQAIITGFYDHETGERISDLSKDNILIEASVIGSHGSQRVLMTDLQLVSAVQRSPSC